MQHSDVLNVHILRPTGSILLVQIGYKYLTFCVICAILMRNNIKEYLMTSSALTSGRASLIDHIIGRLVPKGFQQFNEIFSREVVALEEGPQVIINGQVMQHPGIEHHILFELELLGPGQVISDDGRTEDFELMQFRVSQDQHQRTISVNIYHGEHDEFDRHLQKYFGI